MPWLKGFLSILLLISAAFGGAVWQKHFIPKIAVVDINEVLSQSNKVFTLKEVNNAKLDELSSWLDKAKLTIQNEKDKTKKQDLIVQYQDLARQKESIIRHEYDEKMQTIEANISEIINNIADEQNCSIVLFKTGVFRGGINITPLVITHLKQTE